MGKDEMMLREIPRRTVLKGVSALPLAGVLASPALTAAAAATTMPVSIMVNEKDQVSASLATPKTTPAPAVILIHEWWGLNDQIRTMAAELAKEGYLALAVDLYGGKMATAPEDAQKFMQAVEDEVARATLGAWTGWLRDHKASTGKVAVMGWCFGGGWSLEAAIETDVDAAIIYYGRVNQEKDRLAKIKAPVLGHFATKDAHIDETMVSGFAANMAALEKDLSVHWYDADHAFANPTSARYDEADAQLSWRRTLDFLKENIG